MTERSRLITVAGLLTLIVGVLSVAMLGPTSEHDSTGAAPARSSGLSASLAVPTRAVPAGSSTTGTVFVENKTGHPLNYVCGFSFQAALTTSDHHHAHYPQTFCTTNGIHATVPTGTSRYPIALAARYRHCSFTASPGSRACLANGARPPLQPGMYYASVTLEPDGVPTPHPVAVRVTRSTSRP